MNLQISKINIIILISWVMLSTAKNREIKLVYIQTVAIIFEFFMNILQNINA